MAAIPKKSFFTIDEYLEIEHDSDEKLEYHDRQIFAMAGGNEQHSRISFNTIGSLFNILDGGDCYGAESNFKIRIESTNKNIYPDAMVICGKTEYFEQKKRAS